MKKEIRQKISQAQIGKTISLETRRNISRGRKGLKLHRYKYKVEFEADTLAEIANMFGFSVTMVVHLIKGNTDNLDGTKIYINREICRQD